MDEGTYTLVLADPSKQTSLDSEVIPDPMDTEQPEIDIDEKSILIVECFYKIIL